MAARLASCFKVYSQLVDSRVEQVEVWVAYDDRGIRSGVSEPRRDLAGVVGGKIGANDPLAGNSSCEHQGGGCHDGRDGS